MVRPGASVSEFAVGDEVIGYVREDFLSRGTFAEYVAAPVRTLARKPRNLSFEEAAGLPLVGLTAYQVLAKSLGVRTGETVLVHAAAGGVGSVAVQLARRTWARRTSSARRACATTTSCANWAANPVTYGEGMADRVRKLAPEGIDAVFDTVGGDTLRDSVGLLAPGGRLASIADAGRRRPTAVATTSYAPTPRTSRTSPDLVEQHVVSLHVSDTFPLERAAEAHRLNAEGRTRGKIVVTVDWDD